jgi:DNA repair protein RecO (recombination protein O)
MDWSDHGIVLSVRPHGESAVIATLLTAEHGRHLGLVRGGRGSRSRGVFQLGNVVSASWRARLDEHLGNYACELLNATSALLLDDPLRLAALASACAVADAVLPEREPHARVYAGLLGFLGGLGAEHWRAAYVRWEIDLLADIGFGLDLTCCAATGQTDGLVYVSPKTGRAVSAEAGAPYRDKLLALPAFLLGDQLSTAQSEILAGLALAGHFLERHLFAHQHARMPAARQVLLDRLARPATISGMETNR